MLHKLSANGLFQKIPMGSINVLPLLTFGNSEKFFSPLSPIPIPPAPSDFKSGTLDRNTYLVYMTNEMGAR